MNAELIEEILRRVKVRYETFTDYYATENFFDELALYILEQN